MRKQNTAEAQMAHDTQQDSFGSGLKRLRHKLLHTHAFWGGLLLLAHVVGCADEDEADLQPAESAETVAPNATPFPNRLQGSKFDSPSVRTTGRVIVRATPDSEGERLGLIAKDTRLKPLGLAFGPGCKEGWVQIGEEQWTCGKHLSPDTREPEQLEQPPMPEGSLIPTDYGDVKTSNAPIYASVAAVKKGEPSRRVSGHTVVRKSEVVEINGVNYWRIATGELMLEADLKPYKPSDFHGVFLEKGISLPMLFIMPGPSFQKPGIESPNIVPLAAGRGIARVYERQPTGKLSADRAPIYRYRIGEDEWVSGPLVRYVQEVPVPPDIQPEERWIDIHLKNQVLVAYEGERPVYATLVSSGRLDPTPRGIFRIYLKASETPMGSEDGDDRPYLIENVPWTQFFQAGIALHCAFWHNGFGFPRSRGCVNLAPIDARFLFNWAMPIPPGGWTSLHGSPKVPGTLVRVWDDEQETLHYYGYARDVAKARGVKLKGAPSLKEQMDTTKAELMKRSGVKPTPAPTAAASPSAEGGNRLSEGDRVEPAPAVPSEAPRP